MSLSAWIPCPWCGYAVHPTLTALVPTSSGPFLRVCLKCHTAYVNLRRAEKQRRAAAAGGQAGTAPTTEEVRL